MKKRSVKIAGHSTSITLEEDFWLALNTLAKDKKVAVSTLISIIDADREEHNLSSAIRLYVLKSLQQNR